MKKHHLYLSCVTLTLSLTAAHCFAQTADNPLFRNIPPDATTIYQVNLPVLTTQISWQELMEMAPATKMGAGDPSTAALLQDPALAGIDISKDFFVAEKKPGYDSAGYTTVILHLLDSAKFRAALRKEVPGLKTYPLPNKNKIRLAGKDMLGAAWSKDLAVLVIAKAPLKHQMAAMKPRADKDPAAVAGSISPANSTFTLKAAKRGLAAIQGFDGSFYATDPVFRTGFSDDAAIHIWSEQGRGLSMLGNNPFTARSPVARYLQSGMIASKSNTLTAIRLEPGRITAAMKSVLTPAMKAMYEKMNIRRLDMDLQSRIPPGDMMALINFRFDPLLIGDVLQKSGFRQKIDSLMNAKGLPLDTLLGAFNGDLQFAMMEPTASGPGGKPKFPLYFVTTIRSLSAFSKVTAMIKSMSDSAAIDTATGKRRDPLGKFRDLSTLQGNILVISDSKERSDGWFSNTEKRNTDFLTDRLKDNPFSMFVDFKVVSHFVESKYKDKQPSAKDKKMLDMLHQMDRLEITAGEIKDDKVEAFMELKLADSSPNSIRNFIKGFH